MDKKHMSEEELERKLKDHLKAEAGKRRTPSDLWAKLEPKLDNPAPKQRSRSPWGRFVSWYQARPIPALATAIVLVLAITGAWIITASPWQPTSFPASQPPGFEGRPGLTPSPTPAPTATPAFPGMRSSANSSTAPDSKDGAWIIVGPEGAAGAQGPAGQAGPAGAAGPIVVPGSAPAPGGIAFPNPTAVPIPAPAVTPTPAPALPPIFPPPGDVPTDPSVQRMVIQNGTLSLVVESTSRALDSISQVAKDMGGYVVSARNWQDGKRIAGSIAIRIPAEMFIDAMRAIKAIAVDVPQDEISSQDVTGEFVDLSSRLRTLQATEAALLKIMDKATDVADILAVQRELDDVQGQIEQTQGRMQFLQNSSATSLVQVTLREVGLDVALAPSSRQARLGEEIKFAARVSGGFAPYSLLWDLGDGTTSIEDAPKHAYSKTGKFDITLTVTDDKGNTVKLEQKEFITITPFEVIFNASQTRGKVGDETRFAAQIAGGFPSFTWAWDFGDGTTSTDETPTHAYEKAGKFTVALTMTDEKGNTATQTKKDFITVAAMEAAFGVTTTEVQTGRQVQFSSQVSGGFVPFTYKWDFGDGATSIDRNPTHVYEDAGKYTISLSVTDDKGNLAVKTVKQLMTVAAPPGWDFGKQVENALDALSAIGQGLLTGLIWVVVLVPLWAIVIILIVATVFRLRRSSR